MAIITIRGKGKVEVEVLQKNLDKICDEYVKLEPKENDTDSIRQRYIIPTPGDIYYVNVKLMEGFDFGDSLLFRAISYINNVEVAQADFAPPDKNKELESDPYELDCDGNGVQPTIEVRCGFLKKVATMPYDYESNEAMSNSEKVCSKLPFAPDSSTEHLNPSTRINQRDSTHNHQDAEQVNQDVHQNHDDRSIISSMDATEQLNESSKQSTAHEKTIITPDRSVRSRKASRNVDQSYTFVFHCRSAEFLEDASILKCPLPLYLYDWDVLESGDKNYAIRQLQDLEMSKWNVDGKTLTNYIKGGRNIGARKQLGKDKPKEWRAVSHMSQWEKHEAFEKLKERREARERGEKQFQYQNINGGTIYVGEGANSGVQSQAPPAEGVPAAAPNEENMEASIVQEIPAAARTEQAPPAEETSAAITLESNTKSNVTEETLGVEVNLANVRNSLSKQLNNLDAQAAITQDSTPQVKREPIDVLSLDSDDDIIFLSETNVSKVQGSANSKRVIKQKAAESVDNELPESEDVQKLREEEKKIDREIKILDLKRKKDEIREKIEAAEAKRIKME